MAEQAGVETDQYSVITADGMLTESYLNTGNRSAFRQEGSHPGRMAEAGCTPLEGQTITGINHWQWWSGTPKA